MDFVILGNQDEMSNTRKLNCEFRVFEYNKYDDHAFDLLDVTSWKERGVTISTRFPVIHTSDAVVPVSCVLPDDGVSIDDLRGAVMYTDYDGWGDSPFCHLKAGGIDHTAIIDMTDEYIDQNNELLGYFYLNKREFLGLFKSKKWVVKTDGEGVLLCDKLIPRPARYGVWCAVIDEETVSLVKSLYDVMNTKQYSNIIISGHRAAATGLKALEITLIWGNNNEFRDVISVDFK